MNLIKFMILCAEILKRKISYQITVFEGQQGKSSLLCYLEDNKLNELNEEGIK